MDQLPSVTHSDLLGGKNEFRQNHDASASSESWLKSHEQELTVAVGAAIALAAVAWGGSRLISAAGKKLSGSAESEVLASGAETLAAKITKASAPSARRLAIDIPISTAAAPTTLTRGIQSESLVSRLSAPPFAGVAGDTRSLLAAIQSGQAGKVFTAQTELERALQALSESADRVQAVKAADGTFQLATGIPTPSHHEVDQWVRLTMHDAGPTHSAPLVDQSMRELLGFDPKPGTFSMIDETLINAERADPSNPFSKFMPGLRFEMPGLSVRAKKTP